jgi:hypothetical protein
MHKEELSASCTLSAESSAFFDPAHLYQGRMRHLLAPPHGQEKDEAMGEITAFSLSHWQ